MINDPILTPTEAIEELKRCGVHRSERTLANYRTLGSGPPYLRDGTRPRYPLSSLREWAADQLSPVVHNTTQERQAGAALPGRETS